MLAATPNPFRPTFGVSPGVLAGRRRLLDSFELGLAEGPGSPYRALLISGSRGIGKTVLLNELEDTALTRGWINLRAYPGEDMLSALIHSEIPGALHMLEGEPPKRMISGGAISGLGAVHSIADPAYRAPTPTLITQLRQLANALRPGSGILLTIDEVQSAAPKHLHQIAVAVQDLMRDNYEIAFVAAGLPFGVEKLLQHEGTTFLRRAFRVDLSVLSDAEVSTFYADTISGAGRSVTAGAVSAMVTLAQGYPYLMQVVGSLSWAKATLNEHENIDQGDVEAIAEEVVMRMGLQVHRPSLHDVSAQQLEFLNAMAHLSPEGAPVDTSAVAAHLGSTPKALSTPRHVLLQRNVIIAPTRGKVAFALPYLGQFLNNQPRYQL